MKVLTILLCIQKIGATKILFYSNKVKLCLLYVTQRNQGNQEKMLNLCNATKNVKNCNKILQGNLNKRNKCKYLSTMSDTKRRQRENMNEAFLAIVSFFLSLTNFLSFFFLFSFFLMYPSKNGFPRIVKGDMQDKWMHSFYGNCNGKMEINVLWTNEKSVVWNKKECYKVLYQRYLEASQWTRTIYFFSSLNKRQQRNMAKKSSF